MSAPTLRSSSQNASSPTRQTRTDALPGEYDPDLFDAEVKARRLGADQFDGRALARLLGISHTALRQRLIRGTIEAPDHYEDYSYIEQHIAIWTAVQAVRIIEANRPRREAPCGTWSAAKRHWRRNEPLDDLCRLAARNRELEKRKAGAA